MFFTKMTQHIKFSQCLVGGCTCEGAVIKVNYLPAEMNYRETLREIQGKEKNPHQQIER